jgi:hypothetical protein
VTGRRFAVVAGHQYPSPMAAPRAWPNPPPRAERRAVRTKLSTDAIEELLVLVGESGGRVPIKPEDV